MRNIIKTIRKSNSRFVFYSILSILNFFRMHVSDTCLCIWGSVGVPTIVIKSPIKCTNDCKDEIYEDCSA